MSDRGEGHGGDTGVVLRRCKYHGLLEHSGTNGLCEEICVGDESVCGEPLDEPVTYIPQSLLVELRDWTRGQVKSRETRLGAPDLADEDWSALADGVPA